MALSVKILSAFSGDTLCTVDIDPQESIESLKLLIEESIGIPRVEQRLLLDCKPLFDPDVVAVSIFGSASDDGSASMPQRCAIALMRSDPERARILDEAIKKPKSMHLELIDDRFRNDREIVLALVKGNPYALGWASLECRSDRAIVLAAAKNWSGALSLADEELRRDVDLVTTAVRFKAESLRWVDPILRDDPQFWKELGAEFSRR